MRVATLPSPDIVINKHGYQRGDFFEPLIWLKTRMHSSRMHTGWSLTVFRGQLLPGGTWSSRGVPAWSWGRGGGVYLPGSGGCTWSEGGECTCLVWGCTCLVPGRGMYLPGPRWGVYLPGPGGCTYLVPGVYLVWGEGGVPAWSGGCLVPGGHAWSGGCLVRYSLPCEHVKMVRLQVTVDHKIC